MIIKETMSDGSAIYRDAVTKKEVKLLKMNYAMPYKTGEKYKARIGIGRLPNYVFRYISPAASPDDPMGLLSSILTETQKAKQKTSKKRAVIQKRRIEQKKIA